MKKYLVEITETLQKQITITASSREEAEQKVKEKYRNEEIVLDENDYVDTVFTVLKEKRMKDIEGRWFKYCLSFFHRQVKNTKGWCTLIKKINKEIHRLEQQKGLKSSQKSKLELEINEISGKLKELNSLKNQYEKLEEGVKNFFNPTGEMGHL